MFLAGQLLQFSRSRSLFWFSTVQRFAKMSSNNGPAAAAAAAEAGEPILGTILSNQAALQAKLSALEGRITRELSRLAVGVPGEAAAGDHQLKNVNAEKATLLRENEDLAATVETLLTELHRIDGTRPVRIPSPGTNTPAARPPTNPQATVNKAPVEAISPNATALQKKAEAGGDSSSALTMTQEEAKAAKKAAKEAQKAAAKAANKVDEGPVDVSRLDFRIGKIISAEKHPDADKLYVERIDLGEPEPRTVISGLAAHVPLSEMSNRLVLCLCNLKPAKMRGILSQAMVMCASTAEKVELLRPPAAAEPGDRVTCPGYEDGPPDGQLNPKKQIWETVSVDLATNQEREAAYKGIPLEVAGGKGRITSDSLGGVPVK